MDPKTVLQQFWADFEKGDLDHTWDAYVDADLIIHPSSGFELTRATWLAAEKTLFSSFDDVRTQVLDQVREGDKVATRFAVTGTQKAEFFGVPSAGRTATMTGVTVDVVRDGRIVEHWAEVGISQFLQQLAA